MQTGALVYHFINTVVLTIVVAAVVLWRYKAAVLARMTQQSLTPLPSPPIRECQVHPAASGAKTALIWEARLRARIAAAFFLTTLACGLALAIVVVRLQGMDATPARTMMMALVFTLICAPMVIASVALSPIGGLRGFLLFVLVLTALAVLVDMVEDAALGRSLTPGSSLSAFTTIAAVSMLVPLMFVAITWPKKVRGVVPMTAAGLFIFGLAPLVAYEVTSALSATIAGTTFVDRLGPNGVFILVALPSAWVAWQCLRRLARRYQNKRLSDVQLLCRVWWIVLVAWECIGTTLQGFWLPLAAFTALGLAFAPVNQWALSRALRVVARPAQGTLLLLRVFGHTGRTERLYDRIGARWRLFGPVTMIIGPDVASRTIDPGDYLRWLTGRLADDFVRTQEELDAKLASLDVAADPDGRYRVNEFCCHDNTWRATAAELIQRADAVVMDLRGQTRDHHGCEFELRELASRLTPERIVLIVDRTTDLSIATEAFGSAMPRTRVVELKKRKDLGALFPMLLDAAAALPAAPAGLVSAPDKTV